MTTRDRIGTIHPRDRAAQPLPGRGRAPRDGQPLAPRRARLPRAARRGEPGEARVRSRALHGRFELEATTITLAESQLALSALGALATGDHEATEDPPSPAPARASDADPSRRTVKELPGRRVDA